MNSELDRSWVDIAVGVKTRLRVVITLGLRVGVISWLSGDQMVPLLCVSGKGHHHETQLESVI